MPLLYLTADISQTHRSLGWCWAAAASTRPCVTGAVRWGPCEAPSSASWGAAAGWIRTTGAARHPERQTGRDGNGRDGSESAQVVTLWCHYWASKVSLPDPFSPCLSSPLKFRCLATIQSEWTINIPLTPCWRHFASFRSRYYSHPQQTSALSDLKENPWPSCQLLSSDASLLLNDSYSCGPLWIKTLLSKSHRKWCQIVGWWFPPFHGSFSRSAKQRVFSTDGKQILDLVFHSYLDPLWGKLKWRF